MAPHLLNLASIVKSFGPVRALKGVSFDLRAGEVHAVLGENGAGKSTLIKVITGAHQPDAGTLVVGGEAVAALSPARAREPLRRHHRLGRGGARFRSSGCYSGCNRLQQRLHQCS